ncbi:RidA family protein [Hyphomicrobium sp. MC1]|uniref:RidA family protein n=1 Tax=Hyphomicrobium sp. (strain MC1) TaxID=717785 RepID=UPI000213EF95|nr:RidA family protein [Hyphomicrobium sp. MC1]CCB65461.1 protein of unknown function [Hyphomicrobium sp. MC1]
MNAPTNLLSMRDASGDTRRIIGPIGPHGFPTSIAIDGKIYVGCQSAPIGDIGTQTAGAFKGMIAALDNVDSNMSDLVNLRTYYVYQGGGGKDVTTFWEKMTEVRLRYLSDPGPAATAVRVVGVPTAEHLIGVDGVATISGDRQRLMPKHTWDWSIPTPFSQGWRVGDTIYLGGQLAADMEGKAVALGDVAEQARITLEFIRHVLAEGGHGWDDLATLRICYQAGSSPEEGRATLDTILGVISETIPGTLPAITAFGVDLLYEGLMLEIDGISVKGRKQEIVPPGAMTWMRFDDHPVALAADKEIYVGGLGAPGGASLVAQSEATLDRLNVTLRAADLGYENLVKLTLFYVPDEESTSPESDIKTLTSAIKDYVPDAGPVVTITRTKNLPFPGQRIQLDAVAVR